MGAMSEKGRGLSVYERMQLNTPVFAFASQTMQHPVQELAGLGAALHCLMATCISIACQNAKAQGQRAGATRPDGLLST